MRDTLKILGLMVLNAVLVAGAITIFSLMIGMMAENIYNSSPTLKKVGSVTGKALDKSIREVDKWATK